MMKIQSEVIMMKLMDQAKIMRKEYVYDAYWNVIDDAKDYDKITRKQMIQEIIEFYQNENHIAYLLDIHEYEALKQAVETGTVPIKNAKLLQQKFLILSEDFADDGMIPDELKEIASKSIKNQAVFHQIKELQNFRELVLGVIRTFGIFPYQNLTQLLPQLYPEKDEKTVMDWFLNDSYLHFFYLYEYDEENDLDYIVDKRIDNLFDDLLAQKQNYTFYLPALDTEVLKRIGQDGMDTAVPEIERLKQQIDKDDYADSIIMDNFIKGCHLHKDIKELKHDLQTHPLYRIGAVNIDVDILMEAYPYMPSAALHGCTAKEYEAREAESKKLKKKLNKTEKQVHARLNTRDCDMFYDVYFALLEYANKKLKVNHQKKLRGQSYIDPEKAAQIRDELFKEHRELIDQFVKENPYHLNLEEQSIAQAFKKGKLGLMTLIKYEKNASIFFDQQNNGYRVLGLRVNLDEVFENQELPLICQCLLLPFKNQIIFDGLVRIMPIQMSPRMRNQIINDLKQAPIKDRLDDYLV